MKLPTWDFLFLFVLSIRNTNAQSFFNSNDVECREDVVLQSCPFEDTNFEVPQFTQIGAKKYIMSIDNRLNWFAAGDRCRAYDAQLVNIENDEEMTAISTYLMAKGLKIRFFWISGNDLRQEGNFTWGDTGRLMTYSNWHEGEPNNAHNNEDCVLLAGEFVERFDMNDANCLSQLEYICEKISTVNTNYDVILKIGPPPESFVKIGSKHYLINTNEKMNWFAAGDMCRRQKGDLVNVENDNERSALAKYLADKNINDDFWLSGNDLSREGKWRWGITGSAVTYAEWREGEPNNYDNNENCMLFRKFGEYLIIDTNCKDSHYSICVW